MINEVDKELIRKYFNVPGKKVEVTNSFGRLLAEVDQEDFTCDEIHFKSCTFEEINLIDLKLNRGITFSDCSINKDLKINSLITQNYIQDDVSYETYSIKIHNTTCLGDIIISDCKLNRGLIVNEVNKTNSIHVVKNIFSIGGIEISSSTFLKNSEISYNKLQNDISIDESNFRSRIHLTSNFCSSLVFKKSNFEKESHIFGGEAKNGIIYNDSIFNEVYIQTVRSNGTLSIIGSEFKNVLNVKYYDSINNIHQGCPNIYISTCIFGNECSFNGIGHSGKPYPINNTEIYLTDKLKGKIEFLNFEIQQAKLKGDNNNGNIKFEHVLFKELLITDLINSSKLQFFDIKAIKNENSILKITKSNLSDTEFYNSNLKSFKSIIIQSSILYKIIGSNVTWFEKEQLNPINYTLKNNYKNDWYKYLEKEWKNKREIFRQLKLAMENQGNRINSLEFKSYEMESYKQELLNIYPKSSRIGDRLIMWISQSNDYGLNFLKPFFLIILSAVLCYSIVTVGLSNKLSYTLGGCDDIKNTIKILRLNLNSLFGMINPLFDVNKTFIVQNNEIPIFIGFIIMCYRIILSYLLFQLISAFRKYVK